MSLCNELVGRRAVLKFGSSVLHSSDDLPRVAGEIYRQALIYEELFVVVSAYEGMTDRLIGNYESIAGSTKCDGLAELVSLGEELAAAQLRIACSRIGLEASVIRTEDWGILASDSVEAAIPAEIRGAPPAGAARIKIIPGFVATNESGQRRLLGRGGSDFSAIFLGGELGVDCVRLYKDVDGVYDHDPADRAAPAERFDEVCWGDCLKIARPLLQPNAIEYAKRMRLPIEVGSIGTTKPTIVSARTVPAEPRSAGRRTRIGLAGFGVVGQALFRRLECEPDLEIASILVRDVHKSRAIYPKFALTNDLADFAAQGYDVVVDATCGIEAGSVLAEAQLRLGRALISANKAAIDPGFRRYSELARLNGAHLRLSACVGGGTPVLETAVSARREAPIAEFRGVLNGTVNFLLDQMAKGANFASALAEAQESGFAEDDTSQDLSGADALIKLRLIARLAFECADDDICIRAVNLTRSRIEQIQGSRQRWVQLASLGRAKDGVVGSIGFAPTSILVDFPELPAEWNYATFTTDSGRKFSAIGRGAGGPATAEAIVTDLFAVRQVINANPLSWSGIGAAG